VAVTQKRGAQFLFLFFVEELGLKTIRFAFSILLCASSTFTPLIWILHWKPEILPFARDALDNVYFSDLVF
jgi:hypothetical protein